MDSLMLAVLVIVLVMMALSGVASEAGPRMGTRNGKPGPMQLPDDGSARGEVVRERGLLIDVMG